VAGTVSGSGGVTIVNDVEDVEVDIDVDVEDASSWVGAADIEVYVQLE